MTGRARPGDSAPGDMAGRLTVDLDALCANYRHLAGLAHGSETAAVVKADAYGTGMTGVVPALAAAGCKTFFVALLSEGRAVRELAPDATVYVLGGLPPGHAEAFEAAACRPVLGSPAEIAEWRAHGRSGGRMAAALHVDTGMNRLGLSLEECRALASEGAFGAFETALVVTHPARADDPEDPETDRQKARFDEARTILPEAPAAFANSAALLRDPSFHYDLVRPGIALYGGRAIGGRPNPMRPVVTVTARVIQLRRAAAGETVGYGGAQLLRRDTRLAILSAGYADGYVRLAGGSDERAGGVVHFGSHAAPVVGRVSMDMIAVDVTDLPGDEARPGSEAVLVGKRFTVDDVADLASTIGYEVLTGLGRRFERVYTGGSA